MMRGLLVAAVPDITDTLEITTKIGCPVNCLKYCPQDVLVKRYKGERELTLENFKLLLKTVPKTVDVRFSGFCEPFANRHAIDMMEYAYRQGYLITVFTTLYQATEDDVARLSKLKFGIFRLHFPDGVAMKIPITEAYMRNVFAVIQNVKNVSFMTMNDEFKTVGREDFVRGKISRTRPVRFCPQLYYPDFVLLPNGDLQLCCQDFGLWHTVGNLFKEDYPTIRARFLAHKRDYALCSCCPQNLSRTKAALKYGKVAVERKLKLKE
jgi:hypothetical protein